MRRPPSRPPPDPAGSPAAAGFTTDWLALREPYDQAARAATRLLPRLDDAAGRPRRIVDLGAGTGANLRFLAPRLAGDQVWRLVDKDAGHGTAARQSLTAWADRVGLVEMAGEADGAPVFDRPDGSRLTVAFETVDLAVQPLDQTIAGADLVTASALLDLVTPRWAGTLVTACRARRLPALLALTYTGAIDWRPADPDDALVTVLVNRHQRSDKGFGGRALGPAAGDHVEDLFRRYGFRVTTAETPWRLGPGDAALQLALIDGWAGAAAAVDPASADVIDAWTARRRAALEDGASHLVVAHRDLLATLD